MDSLEEQIDQRSDELFAKQQMTIYKQVDKLFVGLFIFQWIASIIVAMIISPRAWSGLEQSLHPHVYMAVLGGGLISIFPIYLGIFQSGKTLTRYVIAIAQILWSSLFIHLTGGRIETHFHIFGSLAFIAFYKDWKLLIPCTLIVGIDHYIRGVYWPQSVFGIMTPEPWRWLEHASWVLFEDVFLATTCIRRVHEMKAIAHRTAQLEFTNEKIEKIVEIRTRELSNSQKELEKANKSKDQFLANMSHEIRTPLNGIIGIGSLLQETSLDKKQQKYVKIILQSGDILLSVISDILEFSKINSERLTLNCSQFSLEEVISESINIVKHLADAKKIKLHYLIANGIPKEFIGDHLRIKQILLNLLNNALKFTDEGEIKVLVERDEEIKNLRKDFYPLKIVVSDTGIGIPEEKRKIIFKPFYQVDNSNSRKYGGTGLGLSIVSTLVTLMNGTITIVSAVGFGSKFIISLQLENITISQKETIKIPDKILALSEDKSTLQTTKVLVAEDNLSNQHVIEELLKKLGCHVIMASNGKEAFQKLNNDVDICLMDIQMPHMDGLATTMKIRESAYKTLPIIALSASVFDEDKQRCFDAGVNDFLEKPILIQDLRKVLEKWMLK